MIEMVYGISYISFKPTGPYRARCKSDYGGWDVAGMTTHWRGQILPGHKQPSIDSKGRKISCSPMLKDAQSSHDATLCPSHKSCSEEESQKRKAKEPIPRAFHFSEEILQNSSATH